MVLKKTLESPLDCKEIKPGNPKGNWPRILIGRTDAEAETPILWPSGVKSQLIRKDPDVGKDWKQEEKGMIEDEMVIWHQWLNGHEFEQAPGDGEGQASLACCSPGGHKDLGHNWVGEQQQLVGLVGLHRTIQLHWLYWFRHSLGLVWCWMVSLETNRAHYVVFETAPKYCILDSSVDYEDYSIYSKEFLPTEVDIMVIWIKFTHSHPF